MNLVLISGREIADEVPARSVKLINLMMTKKFEYLAENLDKYNPNKTCTLDIYLFGNEEFNQFIRSSVLKGNPPGIIEVPIGAVGPREFSIVKEVYSFFDRLSESHRKDYGKIAKAISSYHSHNIVATTSYHGRTKFAINLARALKIPHLILDCPYVDKRLARMEKYLTRVKTPRYMEVPF